MPHTTVAVFLRRAKEAGLTWPLPSELDDDALERRLFDAAAPSASYAAPDFAAVKKELATKGVTLQLLWLEYKELHPDGYGYSQFCISTARGDVTATSSCVRTTRPQRNSSWTTRA
jgi:transposase